MSTSSIKIAPSLLAADFAHLADEVAKVEKAGCDMLHVDVMDGHFVPNLTVGPFIVKAIRKITSLPLDVHLMIDHPENFIKDFADAGASSITFHAEACEKNMKEMIQMIRARSIGCGISLRPLTPLSKIDAYLKDIDMVLLMTVNPGFGGQAFMPEVLPKVTELRKKFSRDIEVDGGINKDTCARVIDAGANVLVAGTAIFGKADIKQAIEDLRCHK
jgi:ribulose-phosphate 3-epimerase